MSNLIALVYLQQSLRTTLAKFMRFKRYEGDDCRDLTMTQVQSVTMMPTSLQSTPRAESSVKIIRINSANKNGPTHNHNHQTQADVDDYV